MAEYSMNLPPGTTIHSSYAKMLREVAKEATDAAVARFCQPTEAAEPVSGTSQVSKLQDIFTKEPVANGSKASSSQAAEMGAVPGVAKNSRGSSLSHLPIPAGDGVLFWPFKYLPGEIRTMVWVAAAEDAKPRGVYQFKVKNLKLGLASDVYQVSQSMFTNIRRLENDSPTVHEIRAMMQSVYNGDIVTSFTPLPEVGRFTRQIRGLLASCREARSELMRTPEFGGSSFKFHWVDGGKFDLGVMRPFCYDTDWICLSGITHYPMIRPSAVGVICTPDVTRVQHVAFPYSDFSRGQSQQSDDMKLRTLTVFLSLKSLGLYEPFFTIRRVSHWDRKMTSEEKLFTKGVSTLIPKKTTARRVQTICFGHAMIHLKLLIRDVAVMAIIKKRDNWNPVCANFAGLKFCLMLHASSQEGLDLMKFKEDGSHLDDVGRIEDLGDLGREMKGLQINGA